MYYFHVMFGLPFFKNMGKISISRFLVKFYNIIFQNVISSACFSSRWSMLTNLSAKSEFVIFSQIVKE